MEMSSFNISATLSLFRLIARPNLCLPQSTIATFNELPIPLNKAFEGKYKNVDIRAVVLDKDNCFARPHENEVFEEYEVCLFVFRLHFPSDTSHPLKKHLLTNSTEKVRPPQSNLSRSQTLDSLQHSGLLLGSNSFPFGGCYQKYWGACFTTFE